MNTTRFSQTHRLLGLFFGLGIFSQIAQALLVREFLVAFYGNEISLGAFYGGWLFWIAVGAWWGMQQLDHILSPIHRIATLTLALPTILAGQIITIRMARLFWETPAGEFLPLGTLIIAAFVLTAPTGLILGFLFPIACKEKNTHKITSLYVMEALGALTGAGLFVFWMVEQLSVWQCLGVVGMSLGLASLTLHPEKGIRQKRPEVALMLAGLLLWTTPLGTWINAPMERLRFQGVHPELTLLDSVETRFGHTALGKRGEQISVITDGRIGVSFPNPTRVAMEAAFLHTQSNQPRRILLFGSLANGLAGELLRYPSVEQVDVVEEDQVAWQLIQSHLPEAMRATLTNQLIKKHFADGRAFANQLAPQRYDLILILTGDPSSARMNRFFTQEFYARLRLAMTPNGVLCTQVSAASNYLGKEVQSYSGTTFHTLQTVFDQVMVVPGDQHLFCASSATGPITSDPKILATRYLQTHATGTIPPAEFFYSLLPHEQVAMVRQQLEKEEKTINTDLNPVTYFLNMVLWGKFTSANISDFLHLLRRLGPWPYLTPVLVFVGLFSLFRLEPNQKEAHARLGAAFTLGVLGFVSMAMQLMILLGFQARIGHIFSHIALLNGLFMAGLALGAGLTNHMLTPTSPVARQFAGLMVITALFGWWFAPIVAQTMEMNTNLAQNLFFLLATLAGIMAGAGFPLAVRLASNQHTQAPLAGGLAETADHLGGALGGFVAGGLLIPILGMDGSGQLLAMLALLALPPLFPNFKLLTHNHFLTVRQRPSFPAFEKWTHTIQFLLLTTLLLGAIARQAAPPPQTTFTNGQLTEVSGSEQFKFQSTPIPHYLGSGAKPTTVSLSSQPAAPEIRGYAGAINLLVSVSEHGLLQGVQLIHSQETPAYIQGINLWLASKRGHDFKQGPLLLTTPLDGLSGATITSRAALESINQTARAALKVGFKVTLPDFIQEKNTLPHWLQPETLTTVLLLGLAIPVYLRGQRRERLLLLLASLVGLGLLHNTLLTEMDLLHLTQGELPSWTGRRAWWILSLGIGVLSLLWGQIYCSVLCPFGALQEFLAKIGLWLGLRQHLAEPPETLARYGKFLLLAGLFGTAWLTINPQWLAINPMQGLFSNHLNGWLWGVTGIIALASLLYFRFWCRFWCPMGAFFAFFNKIALLESFAPKRRFNQCDLGVKHPFDADCIRCNRCTTSHTLPPLQTKGALRLFAACMVAVAVLLATHLATLLENRPDGVGGWRRIDTNTLQTHIRSGRLTDHEAQWYRQIPTP